MAGTYTPERRHPISIGFGAQNVGHTNRPTVHENQDADHGVSTGSVDEDGKRGGGM